MSDGAPVNPYDVFASVYAHHFGAEALRTFAVYEQLVLRHLSRGARVLDVCCGTGQLAAALSANGLRVVGVDNSPAMLEQARRIAPRATFVCASILDLQLPIGFDAALCTFNSLAHLHSSAELIRAFQNIRRSLRSRAAFAFDLYMESAYLRRWKGEFEVKVRDGRCRILPTYDPRQRVATNVIQLYSDRSAAPETLTMTQHCFSRETVERALLHAGFAHSMTLDAGEHLGLPDESGRAFFLAHAW